MPEAAIRFAIVGCGRIAKNHIGPLTELSGADLVAVCDLVPEKMEAFGLPPSVKRYTNYHQMLSEQQIDVVSIMTPSGMHPTHAIDVLDMLGVGRGI